MTDVTTLLAGIKTRAEKATEGPWEAKPTRAKEWMPYYEVQSSGKLPRSVTPAAVDWEGFGHGATEADAEFIAAARTDVPRLIQALEAVEDLAKVWNAKGEHDMAYSKTIPDEDIAMELLTHGADMVEKARIIRTAVVAALGEDK